MDIAVVIEGIDQTRLKYQPWFRYKEELLEYDIRIRTFNEDDDWLNASFDAMMLYVWLDWNNCDKFDQRRIMPLMEKYATYRARFPATIQIVVNHTDMCRYPYAVSYWRPGDPILFRTPAYDRSELAPFPPKDIWAYEHVWGRAAFRSDEKPIYDAGFIGRPSGPTAYRESVARNTARVGIGICERKGISYREYAAAMSKCGIIVCPRGWGEQSGRHWDAWRSGKPVLTDQFCNSVELVPGMRLEPDKHYLVYDHPAMIPDIVSQWTQPSRLDDLAEIAENGFRAAQGYDAFSRILGFFQSVSAIRDTL